MKNILVIPDSHCRPGVSNVRFEWTAKLIDERRPDVIVHLGDLFDMESLCTYDRGKKSFEGRRYSKDLAVGHDALDKLGRVFNKRYRPRLEFLEGNHEHRICKAIEADGILDGTISLKDLKTEDFGWNFNPFLEPLVLEGVCFSHYFVSGVMAQAIGGENPATNLINKQHRSCVAGHLHLYDYSERTDGAGRKIQAVMAGCFLHPTQWESYAGPANKLWRNSLTFLHGVSGGQFDLEMISIERLRRSYG